MPSCHKNYDWYEERTWVMLVLEYQRDWKDLYSYIDKKGMKEDKACRLTLQLVRAVQHCLKHEVLHNDIHSQNIMVDESGLHLKLTNFRMGRLVKSTGYTSKPREGAKCCIPPEALTRLQYLAMPATVWALGVVLYEMVHGFPPLQRLGVVRITGRNLTMMVLDLTSPATKASISLDHTKPKAIKRPFDCIRRGKVETVPDPQPPVSSSNPSSKDSSDLASQSKVVKGGPEEPTSLIEDYLRRVMLPHRADQAHPDATDKASLPISKTRVSLEGTDMHVRQSKYPMPDVAKNPAAKVSKIPGPESAGQPRKKKTGKPSPKCLLPKGPESFNADYKLHDQDGINSNVVTGIRTVDGKEVTIKRVELDDKDVIHYPGYCKPLPIEVALKLK
ncbi:uncharacterized protein [Misgurnus anguillicaudatus]|uniref:uncharacterized protein isoform X2 n=1 Tax=Misgurnus anguillicaudatus TaxID=75329 RepID=UPI003CCFCCA4